MDHTESLDQQALTHAKGYMGEFAWPTVVFGVAVCSAYLATVALTVLGALPLLGAIPLAGILTYLSYTVLHEAAHGSISGSRRSLRWVNEALGYTAAWILMMPLTAHRHEHLAHHRHTNDADGDPDFSVGGFARSLGDIVRVPLGIYKGQFSYYRENRWARAPGNQNLYLCLEVAAGLLPRLALLAGGLWMEALGLFVVSWWLGLMVTLYLFAYLVHRPHDAVGRYVDSSVVLAPGPLGPIVTALWVCQNYHAIHHLFPRVPFYHYPALYQDIGQIMLARGAPVYQLSWQGLTEQGSPTLA